MAVVVSIARGHGASYPFKMIGAGEGPVITTEAAHRLRISRTLVSRRWTARKRGLADAGRQARGPS